MSDKNRGIKYKLIANADPVIVEAAYGHVQWRGFVEISKHRVWEDPDSELKTGGFLEQQTLLCLDTGETWEDAVSYALELGEKWVEEQYNKKFSIRKEIFKDSK